MNCATCGGKISDIADAVEVQDEGGANRFVHVECSDDPANLPPKHFQTWPAWTFRALTHEAYGQRWDWWMRWTRLPPPLPMPTGPDRSVSRSGAPRPRLWTLPSRCFGRLWTTHWTAAWALRTSFRSSTCAWGNGWRSTITPPPGFSPRASTPSGVGSGRRRTIWMCSRIERRNEQRRRRAALPTTTQSYEAKGV